MLLKNQPAWIEVKDVPAVEHTMSLGNMNKFEGNDTLHEVKLVDRQPLDDLHRHRLHEEDVHTQHLEVIDVAEGKAV